MSAALHIHQASAADAGLLAKLGARFFEAAFGADNTPDDMAAYLKANFSPEQMGVELAEPGTQFLLAYLDDLAIGYAKLSAHLAPEFVRGPRPVELARIYIDLNLTSNGYGSALMSACLEAAAERGAETIWLAVWEHNHRAIRFYARWGFEKVGTQPFVLGRDVQNDYVMARPVHTRPSAAGANPEVHKPLE